MLQINYFPQSLVSSLWGKMKAHVATTVNALSSVYAAISHTHNYADIGFPVTTTSYNGATSGTVTIDGTKAITVLTVTGNISSLSIGNTADMPANHSAHVILTASSAYTVAIAHNATTSVCPDGADPDPLEIPAGGYVEVDFLKVNSKIYVRGV